MTTTHTHTTTLTTDDQPVHEQSAPRRTRTGFDDEMARLIRDRVRSDLAKRTERRHRHREERGALERRRRYAKAALYAEKLAAGAQQTCRCAQPRPPALLARDPDRRAGVLTLCPVCGRSTR